MVDSSFQIKLGRIVTPDGHQKFIRLARHVRRGAGKFGKSQSRRSGASKRQTPLHFQRRVIVKFHLVKMDAQGKARQAQHLDYIARDSATRDNKTGRLFSADEHDLDVEDFKTRSENDPHQFRIIVSPEDSKQLADLDAFTRDLMTSMESDLGTKLDWVAASHYDTATPHVHIVLRGVREDGRELIIPRRYIAHGLREQAESLVTLELGPMHVREAAQKLARQVTQERLTTLDRDLLNRADKTTLIVDIGKTPSAGEAWTRRLDVARLEELARLGLAEKLTPTTWQLAPKMEATLKALGERGDILKAYPKALKTSELYNTHLGDVIYDPAAPNAVPLTGRIIQTGILDDVNDKAYLVIETTSGQSLYIPMGGADNIEGLEAGHIIELTPNRATLKPSDLTIEKIANLNGGIYSTAFHADQDSSARPQFIEAHVRRLEALRRAGLATRNQDGSWRVPQDFHDKVLAMEARKLDQRPVSVRTLARTNLKTMAMTIGKTWLDETLVDGAMDVSSNGFGAEVKKALEQRRAFLLKQKILKSAADKLTQSHLAELEARDLSEAGNDLAERLGKPYAPAPKTGRLAGRLVDSIERPSGRYALIDRAKDFTLVPWRDSLDKRRGMEISATISRGQINWQLRRQRGLDIG